jgi:hypothetical protein
MIVEAALVLGSTQRDLAAKAGLSYSSLRLFEEAGEISIEAPVKIAFVLRAEVEFGQLSPPQAPTTIDDVIDRPLRKRVRNRQIRTCQQMAVMIDLEGRSRKLGTLA